ncbi:glycosyltransferase family 2 protein [Paracoccus sp. T5]|uniref:glycosyltransferase n=1 Tax=Paracoccus sp. T5 TaxID=3402161 RepID=UPI003AD93679
MDPRHVTVIIPAHQEAAHIGRCLLALCRQDLAGGVVHEVVVVPNGCTDATAQIARDMSDRLAAASWRLTVIETPIGSKIEALNLGDAAAPDDIRIYLDADIEVGAGVIAGLFQALAGAGPRYAGARLVVPPPRSALSASYARFWQRLPFVADGVTGAGLFAVNREGRARWDRFPPIIADDGFARLNFAPEERVRVERPYYWPITEGFRRLVRVRRRQDAGNVQLARIFPHLLRNSGKDRPTVRHLLRLALADPVGFAVYSTVTLAVRMRRKSDSWDRGR